MSGGIYLIQGENLAVMNEQPYESEELLQRLLAKYPGLLAGDQINPDAPRRWLLVKREAGIPIEDGGSDNFALDHLFLDQDGVPTLIEVKRATDTRARREVVAQMLDYAANAVTYWPVEQLRAWYEARCQEADPSQGDFAALETNLDYEAFWKQVGTNLAAKKLRLVFVADQIPSELRRLVVFLGEVMKQIEVFAIEIPQFVGQGHRALVPRVIGRAPTPPPSGGGKIVTREEFLDYWKEHDRGRAVFERLFDFAENNDLLIRMGTKGFTMNVVLDERNIDILEGYPPGWTRPLQCYRNYIHKRIRESGAIEEYYRTKLDELGVFRHAPNSSNCSPDDLDADKTQRLLGIVAEVVTMIREHGLASE